VLPGAENHADRVRVELRAGSTGSSIGLDQEVRRAVQDYERGPRSAEVCARVVAGLLAHGEIDAARDYARESLERHPDAVPLLVFAADASYRANDLAGAETLLRQAARRAPHDPMVALDLGLVLKQLGKGDESRQRLVKAADGRSAPIASRARRELTTGH